MWKLPILLIALVLGSVSAFGQGTVSEQPPANGIQPNSTSANQALPGNANPANAAVEGNPNGRAIAPERSKSGPPGMAAGNTPSNDRNAVGRENGNPANPQTVETIARPKLSDTMPWFWSGLGIVGALILIGVLISRSRSRAEDEPGDRRVITMQNRDGSRRDDQFRRTG